jgi:hypothetical protein
VRLVASFSVTSTMWAAPRSSRCDSTPDLAGGSPDALEALAIPLLAVDDSHRVDVRQVVGRHRELHITER